MKKYLVKREVGFTLIELLTVIIIIGVLAAIAIPVFTAQRGRAQDSQTISDVKNIATAAETVLADRTKTVTDLTKANLEFNSSLNVSWEIKGNTTTGGYCIAALNTSGKDYKSNTTLLTYDSTAGGLKRSGGSCDAGQSAGANTPTPSGSTNVGSDTVTALSAPSNVVGSRVAATTVNLTWTKSSSSLANGYQIQRSANGTTGWTTVATVGNVAAYTDSTASSAVQYYRVASAYGTSASSTYSATATAAALFTSQTFSATGSSQSFTVPTTGTYTIETRGAQGGVYNYNYGTGAVIRATHTLTAGDVYTVVVGVAGSGSYYGSSGGGGTFIYKSGAAQPLQVSGGGGGDNGYNGYSGQAASSDITNPGSGNGGSAYRGSGGAGWNTNGDGYWATGGQTKESWAGGSGTCRTGGYGGGGGSGYCDGNSGAGGGGGYTGGYGSWGGGGGTSYLASTGSFISSTSNNNGNGQVTISLN